MCSLAWIKDKEFTTISTKERKLKRSEPPKLALLKSMPPRTKSIIKPGVSYQNVHFSVLKNIIGEQQLSINRLDASRMDLNDEDILKIQKFTNITCINASDNMLNLSTFTCFEKLENVDLSLNEICSLNLQNNALYSLQELNLSFNFLSPEELVTLGSLPNLRVLKISGNELAYLPSNFCQFQEDENSKPILGFNKLEKLHLDDNKLSKPSDIVSLARLPSLIYLNLANNQLTAFPVIRLREDFSTPDDPDGDSTPIIGDPPHVDRYQANAPDASLKKKQISKISTFKAMKSVGKTYRENGDELIKPLRVYGQLSRRDETLVSTKFSQKPIKKKTSSATSNTSQSKAVRYDKSLLVDFDEVVSPSSVSRLIQRCLRRLKGRTDSKDMCARVLLKTNLRRFKIDDSSFENGTTPLGRIPFSKNGSGITNEVFPRLEHLDLSYNKISFEDDILPIIVCPLLQEVSLEGNPLVLRTCKISARLDKIIIQKFAISLECGRNGAWLSPYLRESARGRGKVLGVRRPHRIHSPSHLKPERLVKGKLPPIKRLNIDEALKKQRETICDYVSCVNKIDDHQPEGSDISMATSMGDSCFVTQCNSDEVNGTLRAETGTAESDAKDDLNDAVDHDAKSERQGWLNCPLLPDLDMQVKVDVLPSSIQECLSELQSLLKNESIIPAGVTLNSSASLTVPNAFNPAESLHLINGTQPMDANGDDTPLQLLAVDNPFLSQLTDFTSTAITEKNLALVLQVDESEVKEKRKQMDLKQGCDFRNRASQQVKRVNERRTHAKSAALFSELRKKYASVKEECLQDAKIVVSQEMETLADEFRTMLQYDLMHLES